MEFPSFEDLKKQVDDLKKGKLPNGAFRVERRKCIHDDESYENILVVYPKTINDLQALRDLALEKGYQIVAYDSGYGANFCFKGGKYIIVNTDEFEPRKVELKDEEEYIRNKFGDSPKITEESFENWEGTQKRKRVLASRPETLTQLQNLVRYARDKGLKIRCAGTKHSWAPLFVDEDQICIYLTSLKSDYADGKKIRFSPGSKTEVDVMTGATNADFKTFQLDNKVNLPCNVILTAVQPVSVVATGCHGVGLDCSSPGDYVTKMRIIDGSGELRTYTIKNMDQMRAIQANFGLFGVIFDMTLKLETQHIVETQNVYKTVEEVFYNPNNLKRIVENNWSVEIFWFPFNSLPIRTYHPKKEMVYLRMINKTKEVVEVKQNQFYTCSQYWDRLTQKTLKAATPLLNKFVELTPFVQFSAFRLLKDHVYPEGKIFQELPHAVHFREYIEMTPVHDMEFAFDCKGDYEKIQQIIQIVVKKTEEHFRKGHYYPLNLALEMRWMAYSKSYLCPAIIGNPEFGGSGHVFYIEVLSVDGTNGWYEFCKELGTDWMKLGGMPHLAKEWDFIPGIYEHIRKMFGDNIKKFKKELSDSKADPDGIFINSALRKLFFD